MSSPPSVEMPVDDEEGRSLPSKLNWLRAGVMGANDGIVSTAGIVVGVASAAVSNEALLAAGVAALVAGALSMAAGEYVSVSSQRDSQRSELENEKAQLARNPERELEQLTRLLQAEGIDRPLAKQVAVQLTKKDPLTAHARLELGIDPEAAQQSVARQFCVDAGFRRRRRDPTGGHLAVRA